MVTTIQPQKETLYEEGPATAALSDKVHDLIQMLSEKLDGIWRYDKYMEDCGDDSPCLNVFRELKEDDLRHVQMLRNQIERLCREGNFK